MKQIDIDDELYQYIASNTQSIGESASTILRRLLNLSGEKIHTTKSDTDHKNETVSVSNPSEEQQQVAVVEQPASVAKPPVNKKNANVFNIKCILPNAQN